MCPVNSPRVIDNYVKVLPQIKPVLCKHAFTVEMGKPEITCDQILQRQPFQQASLGSFNSCMWFHGLEDLPGGSGCLLKSFL